jgi:hypothetical protein
LDQIFGGAARRASIIFDVRDVIERVHFMQAHAAIGQHVLGRRVMSHPTQNKIKHRDS